MTVITPKPAAIEETILAYFRALNDADIGAILGLYSNDPVMLPFLQPAVVGIDAVRANYEGTFQLIRFEMKTTIQELVEMSPEWAYVRTDTSGTSGLFSSHVNWGILSTKLRSRAARHRVLRTFMAPSALIKL
jgi:ketosteroid isomerase-like protein